MTLLLDDREPGFAAAFAALVEARREEMADVRDVVSAIIADVRRDGDQALIDCTRRFDRLSLTAAELRLAPERIGAARSGCDPAALAALELAAERIRAFHRRQLPEDMAWVDEMPACVWACAGARSMRWGCMCPAAPPPIPARS